MSVPLLTPPSTTLANPPSDCTLVRYVRGGDDRAAEELYRRYAARLRRIVAERCPSAFSSRFDPEDIVQSVFRSLYEGVRKKFYDIPKGGEIWGLLFVLAANKLRDQISFHQAERRTVHRTEANQAGSLDEFLAADDATAALLKLTVEEYLAGLAVGDRDIVGLRMSGHSIEEIVQQTGRAKRTVERVLQTARDRLAD
jgi:RNA polymerase sigma-70 factor (ECF subfamily)